MRDAELQCRKLGSAPDAVLITGDLTFAGDTNEFKYALTWLEQLCSRCGTDTSKIFIVPGNHDAVRDVARSKLIQALHNEVKGANSVALDAVINGLLMDKDAAQQLYSPLRNYNDFASQFFCALLPPDRTSARRDLELNDGSVLRLTGLNSAFLSSASDKEGDLFVDASYCQLHREPGVIHLTMCHHPFNWLRQGAALRDVLNDVAQIQLFGHEHVNRLDQSQDYVRVYASAALPDKGETDWEPGYNFINLHVEGTGVERRLEVKVFVRVWQQRPGTFRAKVNKHDDSFFEQSIRLDPWVNNKVDELENVSTSEAVSTAEALSETPSTPVENELMQTLREISVRFFKLTLSQKSEIAGKFNLLEETDTKLPDFERFRNALLRAKARGLLAELEQAVGEAESSGQ